MKQLSFFIIFVAFLFKQSYSQTTNDILNVLVNRNLITQQEADSLRSEAALKQPESEAKKKIFTINAGKALQIAGYTQIRCQNLEEAGRNSGFDIRRARIDFKGNISPYFGYRLQPEFAGSSVRLLDAFAEVKLAEEFNLTIGQQKISLSLESQVADNKYDFIDRAQVIEALVSRSRDVISITNHNGRDIGVQANGSLFKLNNRPLIDYWVGVFNGTGINVGSDNNKFKDAAARLVFHPIQGLDLGGSIYDGVGFYGTPTANNHGRTRWGVELKYEIKNFLFQGEYLKGKDNPITREGYYVQAGYYIIPQKFQAVAKYDTYDPDKSADSNISTLYTLGLNYSFNANTRLQTAYTIRKEQGSEIRNNYAVAQFLIGF